MRPANQKLRSEVLRIVELKLQDGAKRARLKYADIAAACNVQPDTLARAVCVEMKRRRGTNAFPVSPAEMEKNL
jgi:hypothetical protein